MGSAGSYFDKKRSTRHLIFVEFILSILDPLTAYQSLINAGEIEKELSQGMAVQKLQELFVKLHEYERYVGRTGWFARLNFSGKKIKVPKGLYLWGGVGRGKSMLMDLFYEHCAVSEREKKHVHFHAFMLEVHSRVHSFRAAQKAGKVSLNRDPLLALSKIIIDQAWLLCFDEFHVTDIADAMVLGRLFEALFDQGVVIVATSNRHPKDLYKDGLQRERFLPFIDSIIQHMDIIELESPKDYRLDHLRNMDVYIIPSGPESTVRLEADFERLTLGVKPAPVSLKVNGRKLHIPLVAKGVAFSHFDDLCGKSLGPADYMEIARAFHTLVLADIPKMGPQLRDKAKRFVSLIDVLYEANVNLICSAEALPMDLYVDGDGAFEFERTVSRLMEMQSEEYLARYKEA